MKQGMSFPEHFYSRYFKLMEGKKYNRLQHDLRWDDLFPLLKDKCRCGCNKENDYKKRWFSKEHKDSAFTFYCLVKGMVHWQRRYLCEKGKYQCADCGGELNTWDAEYDHKEALILGGTNLPENWQILCRSCHLNKTKIDLMAHRLNKGTLKIIRSPMQPILFH